MIILKSNQVKVRNFLERESSKQEGKKYYVAELVDKENIVFTIFIQKELINTSLLGKEVTLYYVMDLRGNLILNRIEG